MGITAPGAQPEQRASGGGAAAAPGAVVRQPAEVRCAAELEALRAADRWSRPPGWQLSPRMVETFVMGGPLPDAPGTSGAPGGAISPKFVGDRRLVQVAIATLASDRALMLAGQPGTAKCVKGDTLVLDVRTGRRQTIQSVCERRDVVVATLDGALKLQQAAPADYVENGVRPCYRVVTTLGREIAVTLSHPFLTLDGWKPLGDLAVGSRIAVPRVLPYFGEEQLSDAHVRLLAHLIAEGCLTQNLPYFSGSDPDMQRDFSAAVSEAFPGLTAHWHPAGRDCSVSGGRRGPHQGNPCTAWLRSLGLMGMDAARKFIPEVVFSLPRRQIALFLNRLFSGDGFVHLREGTGQVTIDYSSKSKRLVLDVQHLLLRFGINATIQCRPTPGYAWPHFRLYIYGTADCLTFLQEIGLVSSARTGAVLARLRRYPGASNPNRDTVPSGIWAHIKHAAVGAGYRNTTHLVSADRGVPYRGGSHRTTQSVSRARLQRLATLAASSDLAEVASSDVYWDTIKSIEFDGEHPVFDLSVAGTHNFVANDFIVHNSWLSEHLAAAISGTSQLIIQGTAGTTEEQIKYSWNYALLIAEGPSRRALVESPVLRGMQRGQVVRCEELTRCAAEVQDALISVLSEKQVVIAELEEVVPAQRGFAVIGTANTRDRGVNEMSAALKRRFNFVVIPVLSDPEQEAQIVARRSRELLQDLQVQAEVPPDVVRLLTAVFAELRQGQTLDGSAKVKSPSTVLSTAELISVVADGALMGAFFGSGRTELRDCFAALVGTVAKENRNDLEVLQEYLETVVKGRRERPWPEFYAAGREVLR